ncbi:MAG: MerR family transcriptional regulator [Planctomycetes bacterium]|nr:MerR family transcriptional regulator [Planctomycetota bacterium]
MDRSGLFTISEFARISGISRDNLIFYDRIGVLKPEKVDYNGYRYYSIRQIWLVYFVMMFKEFGMPLEKIKKISRDRTPERILQVFSNQKEVIGREIRKLQQRLLMIVAL